MVDYEIDDETSCPFCHHDGIHYRHCGACEDGWIDECEDDAINFAPGLEFRRCEICLGTGIERWCPGCGADLTGVGD